MARTGAAQVPDSTDRLDMGFFKRLFVPANEEHFVDDMKAFPIGDNAKAIAMFDVPDALPDALFMTGMLALKAERHDDALAFFDRIGGNASVLGTYFRRYGLHAEVSLPITERIHAVIAPSQDSLALARGEAQQACGNWKGTLAILEALHGRSPTDPVGILSLAEVVVEDQGDDAAFRRVVTLGEGVTNDSELEAAIFYWKGRALHGLKWLGAARDTLTGAFARKKGRDVDLLLAVQHERALVYEDMGKHNRTREEFGFIFAQNPDYADVAKHI